MITLAVAGILAGCGTPTVTPPEKVHYWTPSPTIEAAVPTATPESPMATPTLEPTPTPTPPAETVQAQSTGIVQVLSPDGERVERIRTLFGQWSPLLPLADRMVELADLYGYDWRLIPIISVLESSAGRNACRGNAWGYASCRTTWTSFEEGLEVVALTLSKVPYTGRTVEGKFCMWVSGSTCEHPLSLRYIQNARSLLYQLGE